MPLSGVEVGTMLNITHRLKPAEWGRVSFGLRYDERRYMLSSAAKRAVPTASGSDYAFTALDVHMRIDFASKKERARTTAEIGLSQAWQAGERIATGQRLRLSRGFASERLTFASYGISLQDQTRHDSALRSNTTYTVDDFALRKLSNDSLLRYGAALSKVDSASSGMAHTAATLSLAYLPAAPLLGAQASFSGALQPREYDRLRYGSTLRCDQKLSLSANFVFKQIDYMGFYPSLTLNATRNISNKTLFYTQELGLSLGIKSTF